MSIKEEFPIFRHHPNLVYLDNAATTQKPQCVIDRIKKFYEEENANIHRGIYPLSEKATELYENARKKVAEFLGAKSSEIVFTSGTTEGINIVAENILPLLKGRKELVLTEIEHHSNIVPWQEIAKKEGLKIKYIPIKKDFTLDLEKAKDLITKDTGLVSLNYIGNVLGVTNPIEKISKIAKEKGALVFVDAAQSIAQKNSDVKTFLNCDFLTFSGHKVYGPTGVGVLYIKEELMEQLSPYKKGGGMIELVEKKRSTFRKGPQKFEAGTPNIAGVLGLEKAIEWIKEKHYHGKHLVLFDLTRYALKELKSLEGITIYANNDRTNGIIAFTIDGIHPHDIADILGQEGICIRAGHHCAQPLMKVLGVNATCRISLAIYNTKEDIDALITGLKKVQEVFKK